jgi:hypothetical protein
MSDKTIVGFRSKGKGKDRKVYPVTVADVKRTGVMPKSSIHAVYNEATDYVSIRFPAKPSVEVRNDLKRNGFRWSPRNKYWYAKWTDWREDFAKGMSGSFQKIDVKPDFARKGQRARELAEKHRKEQAERSDKAHKLLGAIPFGQPILVGHHSERRHRSDLRKIQRNEEKAREHGEIAEKYEKRAERFERKATGGENPVTIHNRIEKLEAEERRFERELREAEWRSIGSVEDHKKWAKRNLEHTKKKLKREREKYKKSGGMPSDFLTFKVGDRIDHHLGKGTVMKVSKKTLRVKFDNPAISMMGHKKLGIKVKVKNIRGKVVD